MTYNPGGVVTAGAPLVIPTAPVAVGVNTAGTIAGPAGYQCRDAVFSNDSPFICMVATLSGTKTLPPFTADICVPTVSGFTFAMYQAPGGPTMSLGASFVQADFYVAGGGAIPGTYPFSLTAPNEITVTATYVTPVAPGPGSGSEPANEVQIAARPGLVLVAGSEQVMSEVPTMAQQLRLWWAQASCEATGTISIVCPSGAPGSAFCRSVAIGTPICMGPIPVGGLALGAGQSISVGNVGGSNGAVSGWALYTLETI